MPTDHTIPTTRGTAIRSITSNDGGSQIRLIPVLQGETVVSYYLAIYDGKTTTECNTSIDKLHALIGTV